MKIRELMDSIQKGEQGKALHLAEKLYNDVRDFSQCIEVREEDGDIIVEKFHDRNGSYVLSMKRKIQEWVGGH